MKRRTLDFLSSAGGSHTPRRRTTTKGSAATAARESLFKGGTLSSPDTMKDTVAACPPVR